MLTTRHSIPAAASSAAALSASLGAGFEEMDTIIERAMSKLALPRDIVERYLLRHLRFIMGPDELAGLEEFYRRACAHGAVEEVTPVRFLQP